MALAGVLSAVRQLVLDGIELPPDRSGRHELYARRFTDLSDEEIEDLAKIEPSRLSLYTRSIFSAEGRMLRSYFPFTLGLLTRCSEEELSPAEVARRVHGVAPWRGLHSPSLGVCFGQYIARHRADLLAREPAIEDVYRFEQAALEIRKAPNEEIPPQEQGVLARYASSSVDDLLALEVFVPSLTLVLSLSFDVRGGRGEFLKTGRIGAIAIHSHTIVGGRPTDYGAEWCEVPKAFGDRVKHHRGSTLTVALLAEAFLEEASYTSDVESFQAFFRVLEECIGCGALCALHQEV